MIMLYNELVDEFDVDGITNVRVHVFDSGEEFYDAFKSTIVRLITGYFYDMYHKYRGK